MAATGNHGRIIPRDKELLTKLYWKEEKTLPEIGSMFGVTHKSVLAVFRKLCIPTRPVGQPSKTRCIDCGSKVLHKTKHPLTKNGYGRRCKDCQRKHKNKLSVDYVKSGRIPDHTLVARKYAVYRDSLIGPLNPKGEKQWIRKSKILVRTAKKLVRGQRFPEVSQYLKKASEQAETSQT